MTYEFAPWFVDTLRIVAGPLTGAFAGAMAAQGIAKRNADTQRDLQEARATNLAIGTLSALINTIASLKRQHVVPMRASYDELCAELERVRKARSKEFKFDADLKSLLPMTTPLPMLEKLMYERISLSGGAMNLFALMAQSLGNLSGAMASRSQQIEELRLKGLRAPGELATIYFGLPDDHGHTDTRFRDTIHSIALYTDDAILFGVLLTNELVRHATKLFAGGRKGFPHPVRPDFQRLADLGLMPEIGETEAELLKSLQIEPVLPMPQAQLPKS